jgi:hypothetical protein
MKLDTEFSQRNTKVHGASGKPNRSGNRGVFGPLISDVSGNPSRDLSSASGLLLSEIEPIPARTSNSGGIMKIIQGIHRTPCFPGLLTLCVLTACDTGTPQVNESNRSESIDRVHEKSFSWDARNSQVTQFGELAKTQTRTTRFSDSSEFSTAVLAMSGSLEESGASDSLWKPIDYACDELALGLWNKYGSISVGDSAVLDEASLKAGCRYIGDDAALGKSAQTHNDLAGAVVDIREYPYKMIGESWDKNVFSALGFTGASTQFKKHRSKFGILGWYDTDASRIGIKLYMLTCSYETNQRCVLGETRSDFDQNDDYVSSRVFAAGEGLVFGVVPSRSSSGSDLVQMVRHDAVIAMHSVDHAGIRFRASSSSGLSRNDVIVETFPMTYLSW